jgi:hypothetical protein
MPIVEEKGKYLWRKGEHNFLKEWQGLSDEDVTDLLNFWNISDIEIEPFITMVANKVKEKNNGI